MRESFLKLLQGQTPDEIVWTADITYWIDGHVQSGDADPTWQQEVGHLELCRNLGFMPYLWYGRFWAHQPHEANQINIEVATEGNTHRKIWTTSVGTLTVESVKVQGSWSEAPTRYPVQSVEDLKILLWLLEHMRYEPDNFDDFEQRIKLWAQYDGVPSLGMPRCPLSAFFTEWAGVMHGLFLIADAPEMVEEVLDRMERLEAPILDAVCEPAPPIVHFPDNLSSENLAGLFDGHMASRYRRRLDQLHAVGTACAVHLDGAVRGLLAKLAAIGFDAIEAITPQPVGDVDVKNMRDLADNNSVILWGSVAKPF